MASTASPPSPPGWTGLTIKEILERVDLFNVTLDEDGNPAKKNANDDSKGMAAVASSLLQQDKDAKASAGPVLDGSDPSAAFLGPKLWDNPITLPLNSEGTNAVVAASANADYSVMDLEDFLQENNLDMDEEEDEEVEVEVKSGGHKVVEEVQPADEEHPSPPAKKARDGRVERNRLPKAENAFLYAESKRARAEREKQERRRRKEAEAEERAMLEQQPAETDVQFAPEDLALATIPGMDFDPRKRAFSVDELKPQPIIKKRKKTYVNPLEKDGKYWAKREKNNLAARRSREARRLKENQIALRAAFLEKENGALRMRLKEAKAARDAAARECQALKEQLARYE